MIDLLINLIMNLWCLDDGNKRNLLFGYKYPSDCARCGTFILNKKKAFAHKKECEGGESKFKTYEDIEREISEDSILVCLERMENDFKNIYFDRFGHDKETLKPDVMYPKYCECGYVLTKKEAAYAHKKVCPIWIIV